LRRVLALSIVAAVTGCGSSPSGAPEEQDAYAPEDGGDGGVTGDGGTDGATDADTGPPHGTIDPTGKGGTVNRLSFTAFGDIRPALPDEDFAYPNDTVKSIMSGMNALSPEFAVASGDYMFVELIPASAKGQLSALLEDEKAFTAPIFHTMGNHECQSFSDVNCPKLNESTNITTFMQMLLPWSQVPWFSFVVHTDLGDAKLVFVAVNAWNDAQATWLDQTMAAPTRYTFVIRHQPTPDAGKPSSAEGIAASDAILNKYPVTLFLFGHVHEYTRLAANRVIVGNAGAPLDSGSFGYAHVEQRPDGNVAVTEYVQGTNAQLDAWAVTPDGQDAP
jgi:hypothetical protein